MDDTTRTMRLAIGPGADAGAVPGLALSSPRDDARLGNEQVEELVDVVFGPMMLTPTEGITAPSKEQWNRMFEDLVRVLSASRP